MVDDALGGLSLIQSPIVQGFTYVAPSVLEEMSRPRTSHARSPRRARYTRNSLRSEEVMRLPFANAGPSGTNNCCDTLTANMSGVVLGDESPSASATLPLQTTPIHGPQLNGNSLMMTTNTLLSSKDALQHLQQQQHLHMQQQQQHPPGATGGSHMHHNMHQHLHHHSAFPARPSPQDELMDGDPALPFV